jgi:hypothetical protein
MFLSFTLSTMICSSKMLETLPSMNSWNAAISCQKTSINYLNKNHALILVHFSTHYRDKEDIENHFWQTSATQLPTNESFQHIRSFTKKESLRE